MEEAPGRNLSVRYGWSLPITKKALYNCFGNKEQAGYQGQQNKHDFFDIRQTENQRDGYQRKIAASGKRKRDSTGYEHEAETAEQMVFFPAAVKGIVSDQRQSHNHSLRKDVRIVKGGGNPHNRRF